MKQQIKLNDPQKQTLKDLHNYIISNSKRGRPKGILKTRISFRICNKILDNMEFILRQTGIKKVDYINEAILQYNEKMMELAKRQYKVNWNINEETI